MPWLANTLTLAALVGVTYWSAANRPTPAELPLAAGAQTATAPLVSAATPADGADAAQGGARIQLAADLGVQPQASRGGAATGATTAAWGHAPSVSRSDSSTVQPVAFLPALGTR